MRLFSAVLSRGSLASFAVLLTTAGCSTSDSSAKPAPSEATEKDAATPPPPAFDAAADAGIDSAAPIGAAGGELTSADGRARITVPAGALTKDEPIAITPASSAGATGASAASGVYTFEPSGLAFAKDAEICLETDPSADTGKACLGYFDDKKNTWECEDRCLTKRKEGQGLCGTTNHFTNFAILLSGGHGADPNCADARIPTSGGSLASPDNGALLSAPAGSLTAPTRITVTRVVDTATKLGSEVYDFSPDGTTFPGKLDLCITSKPASETGKECLGYLNKDSKWACEDTCLERKGGQLCGQTSHFTNFAILLSGGSGTNCK